ncbi:hypothetical protein HJG60_009911 [Phyllostomus discolor]|uniref:Uncharacterized protein n=1 Tax=Phyllostomus discolor TaxID=89673 RepID=A0A834ELI6_9CHIR|nr:hypothetical protein HJG60_009911 [Phyllostomus discolor]
MCRPSPADRVTTAAEVRAPRPKKNRDAEPGHPRFAAAAGQLLCLLLLCGALDTRSSKGQVPERKVAWRSNSTAQRVVSRFNFFSSVLPFSFSRLRKRCQFSREQASCWLMLWTTVSLHQSRQRRVWGLLWIEMTFYFHFAVFIPLPLAPPPALKKNKTPNCGSFPE